MRLVTSDHPALWQVAQPVTDFDAARALAATMMGLMAEHRGAGLAAPQVGVSQRLFVMRDGEFGIHVMNPVIVSHGRDEETAVEGCLSFPGQRAFIKRWRVISVEYHDGVTLVKRTLKGWPARVFQHEIAHLDGICIMPKPEPSHA